MMRDLHLLQDLLKVCPQGWGRPRGGAARGGGVPRGWGPRTRVGPPNQGGGPSPGWCGMGWGGPPQGRPHPTPPSCSPPFQSLRVGADNPGWGFRWPRTVTRTGYDSQLPLVSLGHRGAAHLKRRDQRAPTPPRHGRRSPLSALPRETAPVVDETPHEVFYLDALAIEPRIALPLAASTRRGPCKHWLNANLHAQSLRLVRRWVAVAIDAAIASLRAMFFACQILAQ